MVPNAILKNKVSGLIRGVFSGDFMDEIDFFKIIVSFYNFYYIFET